MSKAVRETVCLDGTWKIAFDPADSGKKGKWFAKFPLAKSRDITVPSVWDEIRPDYDGVAWYYRTLSIQPQWLDKRICIRFGAVHYYCDIWVNGKFVESHEGGYVPVLVDITRFVHAGTDNTVVLRVIEPPKNRRVQDFIAGFPLAQTDLPDWKAGWYYTFGGIWQSTRLEITARTYIDDYFIITNIYKKTIDLTVELAGRGQGLDLVLKVTPKNAPGTVAGRALLKVKKINGKAKIKTTIKIKNAVLWDCDNPFLYTLSLELRQGNAVVDATAWNFGLREFTVKNEQFTLNNKRIVIKGVLDQGVYAKTLVYPVDREAARREVRLLKQAGFNFIRLHIKPTTEMLLDACDEEGLLLLAEPQTGWIGFSDKTIERCKRCVYQLIKRDHNRTAIVMWCIFNEIGHANFVREGGDLHKLVGECHEIIHSMDPTRIIMDNSGISYGGAHYFMPYENKSREWVEDHIYLNPPLTPAHWNRLSNLGKEKKMLVFASEFGVGAEPDFDQVVNSFSAKDQKLKVRDYQQWKEFRDSLKEGFDKYKVNKVFGSLRNFCLESQRVGAEANNDYVRALRTNPRTAGYIVTQWADAASENAGIVDIWRHPKKTYFGFKDLNQTPHLIFKVIQHTYYRGGTLTGSLELVNENNLGPAYIVQAELSGAGRKVWSKTYRIKAASFIQKIDDLKIALNCPAGQYKLTARLLAAGGREICRDTVNVYTYDCSKLTQERMCCWMDPANKLVPWIKQLGLKARPYYNQYPHGNTTVFVVMHDYEDYARWWHEFNMLNLRVNQGNVNVVLLEGSTQCLYKTLLPEPVTVELINRGYRGAQTWFARHALLKGLYSQNCMLTDEYTNVAPLYVHRMKTIKKLKGDTVVGFATHYQFGFPNIFYFGSGLEVVRMGKGQVVLSQMKVLENLGKDPVADIMFNNMLNLK
jgi:hypothetical protein